jgi:5'-nucleotidase
MSVKIPILAFNDVYRVSQKYVSQPGAPPDPSSSKGEGQISVSRFGELLLSQRGSWPDRRSQDEKHGDKEKEKEGLVLFAGDVFSPSVESSVTRGSHMVGSVS